MIKLKIKLNQKIKMKQKLKEILQDRELILPLPRQERLYEDMQTTCKSCEHYETMNCEHPNCHKQRVLIQKYEYEGK